LPSLQQKLRVLAPGMLRDIRRGIEKESLRVTPVGKLARTPHPSGLGSPLTHPNITTDFSESQLELITGVHGSIESCLEELAAIHQFVYRHIGDELLWCASMPCGLPGDDSIPIGQYGSSNVGRAKTVYRTGLSYRYGRRMQTISGIHYNFSLPDGAMAELQKVDAAAGPLQSYQDDAYFALIRNFRRHSWLLLYLFGASPAVCSSFVEGRDHPLRELRPGVHYLPWATSLRMSPLGYQSEAQASLAVSYNCLESYARSLYGALTEPYPPYTAIGIRDGDAYRQLSDTLLQIENEFYGTIRPKRPIRPGERPLHALRERGVEYVEVRCIDLDPFSAIGIDAATIRFIDLFLLYCLLDDSAADSPEEIAANARNQLAIAENGRDPALRLERGGDTASPAEWGGALLRNAEPIAEALDAAHGAHAYRDALAAAAEALARPQTTPSARVLAEMAQHHHNSFPAWALARSQQYRKDLQSRPLHADALARFVRMAEESLAQQRRIEAADTMPFEIYRQHYLSASRLSAERR
jgi:glutamate--cysteine ligase